MTPEEKQLLVKDLSARLPYGVKMRYKDEPGYEVLCQIDTFYEDIDGFRCLLRTTGPFGGFLDLNELKPYLRSMSSMTEYEDNELDKIDKESSRIFFDDLHSRVEKFGREKLRGFLPDYENLDYLNAHHFDYRGLIEKGLALEAPEGMYKTE